MLPPRRWAALAAIAATTILNVAVPSTGARAAGDPKILLGEGGSFDGPIINKLLTDAAPTVSPLTTSYLDANIDRGRDEFAAGEADFVLSEFPLSGDQAAATAKNGRAFAYVPLIATAVGLGVVLVRSGATLGTPDPVYTGLKLKVTTLTKIFTLAINSWKDPLIANDNGGLNLSINTVGISTRFTVDPSKDIYGLISLFLQDKDARPIWNSFAAAEKQPPDTPLEQFPTNSGISGGDQQVANALIPVAPDTGKVFGDPQAWGNGLIAPIGVDWTGPPRNVPMISLENAAGGFVPPTPPAITAALSDATMDSATNLVTFKANPNNTAAYAIPAVSYMVVPTKGLDPVKAKALAAFIRFVYSDAGATDIKGLGAVPVTDQMKSAGLQVATLVEAQGTSSPLPTTTSSSRPSASTTSTTAQLTGGRTGSAAQGVSGQAGTGAGQTGSSGTLPNTGQNSLAEVVAGGVLLVGGEAVRRRVRSRSR